ncbi:MAG: glycerol-3-phosphate 1-O-acyltransferase PlsY [Pseudomonadota bacterium]
MPEITSAPMVLAAAGVLGYLLGSVPFGIVIARAFGLGDLRAIGSGNIGATNVLRTGNRWAAFLTLILDAGKGGAAVLFARATAGEDAAQIAGLAAFIGHLYPVWLRFEGGKGVATFLGTLLALAWPVGLAACTTWLVTAGLFRMSSLAALVSAALAAPIAWLLGSSQFVFLILLLAAFVFFRHAANIQRIASGKEPRIGQKG